MRGFAPNIYRENLVQLLEVNLTNLWRPPPHHDWVPLDLSALRVVHTEPAVICHVRFAFSYPSPASHSGFHTSSFHSISVYGRFHRAAVLLDGRGEPVYLLRRYLFSDKKGSSTDSFCKNMDGL